MVAEKSRQQDKLSRLKHGDLLSEISFKHWGTVPSKSNFRKGSNGWRKGWKNIKTFEEAIGLLALQAGARPMYRKMPVEVEAVLVHQRLDVDNAGKAILDGLEGVCYQDDSQVFRWSVMEAHDSYPSLARVEIAVRWYCKGAYVDCEEAS